ncbi:MAG: alpha-ketoglutarate-dependent dioxygenase AlkB, partial [Planctomycetes bacterium]|nr:alpha-ketoglutarate-dependent dioxygenase AlkB [Planctomycetota bacterium]
MDEHGTGMANSSSTTDDHFTTPTNSPSGTSPTKGLSGSGPPTTSHSLKTYLATPLNDGRSDCRHSFLSPSTCLELLPSLTIEQLRREMEYHSTLCGLAESDLDGGVKTRNAAKSTKPYVEILERHFNKHFARDADNHAKTLNKYTNLTSHLSEEIDEAKKFIAKLLILADDDTYSGASRTLPPTPPAPPLKTVAQPSPPSPVTFENFDFSSLDVQSVCRDVSFRTVGQRQTAYFGKTEYHYANVKHKPCNYPVNHPLTDIINTISAQMNDPTFNTDNISCLLTLYKNGKSNIPMHSDDEPSIVSTSQIVTVSLGSTRKLRFRSKVGPICIKEFDLNHGHVYTMTRNSQDFWEHSIPPDHTVQGQRLSLTFRRLTPPTSP